jgi:hypothetical protein
MGSGLVFALVFQLILALTLCVALGWAALT